MLAVSIAASPPRCHVHDLTIGPDGQCVVCRRSRAKGSWASKARPVATMALAVVVGGWMAYEWRETNGPLDAAAVQAMRGHVRLYTTSWCPHCKRAKQWLAAQHVDYEEVRVERDPAAKRALLAISPRGSIPALDANGEVVVGFDEGAYKVAIKRGAKKLP
jgi:glutaredoxin 3